MNNQGRETKEIENQPRLSKCNLNIIWTCNRYTNMYRMLISRSFTTIAKYAQYQANSFQESLKVEPY